MSKNNGHAAQRRIDAVMIRKSTDSQDEKSQIANVEKLLAEIGVTVPDENWFVCTVPRAKVKGNPVFRRLMELVTSDAIGTVYVESQDRFGTDNARQLAVLLEVFADHGTRLYDLRNRLDLTSTDDITDMTVFLGSQKSKAERRDLSYRSLRTRVAFFQETGSWPTGSQPFGYGKRCYAADGALLWEWQPISRTMGHVLRPGPGGKLIAGSSLERIPPKVKGQRSRTVLVPSSNKEHVKTIRLIFDLFTRVGLSRRAISKRMNDEGRRFYDSHFTHTLVTNILQNPAYVGDTHFGKTQGGRHHTFDGSGVLIKVDKPTKLRVRKIDNRLVRQKTHKGLVDRATWELALAKFASERGDKNRAPQNAAYYLKQVFFCGHCGHSLCGRTERDPATGKAKVVYVCSTYVAGISAGRKTACGYYRITHEQAEQMLFDKIKEMGLQHDTTRSMAARENIEQQLKRLDTEYDKDREKLWDWLQEGVSSLLEYMRVEFGLRGPALKQLEKLAAAFYRWGRLGRNALEGLPLVLADFKRAVREAEAADVAKAKGQLTRLDAEHTQCTLAWASASPDMQAKLKARCVQLEDELAQWRHRTTRLSERFEKLHKEEATRDNTRRQLLAEWPKMDNREKGEALRRLFKRVALYWTATHHAPEAKPSRPRKTQRNGRNSYRLQTDQTSWALTDCNLASHW